MVARRTRRGGEAATLFEQRSSADPQGVPLAERMRPVTLETFVGQQKILRARMFSDPSPDRSVPSMIFWGPPGVGKTTLARLIADSMRAEFAQFSAVLGSVAELRDVLERAKEARAYHGRRTLLFVDEIHRFNRAQQDAFLPHVENGLVTLIGATTENPSFAVNAALLSRCKVFHLDPLGEDDLRLLVRRALEDVDRGLGRERFEMDEDALAALARSASGDARRALTSLEAVAMELRSRQELRITLDVLRQVLGNEPLRHDKAQEDHYNVTSAFIKSLRGSDVDAAIYWMMRMVEAGEDPLFLLRRMMIFASEDIGLADSRALLVVVAADEAFRRMGMPEGMYPLAHACCYLACAPKSNAVNVAWHRAQEAVRERGTLEVPMKLRNAVTSLMKNEGYGVDYKYAHSHGGVVLGETYLPEALVGEAFYEPTERGEEARIKPRVESLREAQRKVLPRP